MFHVKHFDTRFWDCGVKHLIGLGVKHFFVGQRDVLERGDVLGRGLRLWDRRAPSRDFTKGAGVGIGHGPGRR